MARNGENSGTNLSDARQRRSGGDFEEHDTVAYTSHSHDAPQEREYPRIKQHGMARFLYPAAVIAAAILLLAMVAV